MKKIKSIYLLFVFAAISSYGLWACTNTNTSETTTETEPEKTALDSLPVTAAIDSNFYIKVNLQGQDHTFNFLTLDKAEGNNILTPNLFRIKRCEDVSCINSFYLQAHNFDFNQTPPFTLEADKNDKKQRIILSFITMTKQAKQVKKLKPEDITDIKITINKIEDDIYEGNFSGRVEAQSDSLSVISGSFRTKMIIEKPAA